MSAVYLADDPVEDDFQGPWLQQAETNFHQQRRTRADDQPAMLARLRPKVTEHAPQARQAFFECFRLRHFTGQLPPAPKMLCTVGSVNPVAQAGGSAVRPCPTCIGET